MAISGQEVQRRLEAFDRRQDEVDELEHRLIRAVAVIHLFDPLRISKQLDVSPRDILRKLAGKVRTENDEDGVPCWTLRLAPRQRALRELGTAERIRGELEVHSDLRRGPVQRAFEALLEGKVAPVESLEQPTIRALQIATQWLEVTEVSLPWTIKELERPAHLARLRAELRKAAGPHFQGRGTELAMLRDFTTRHDVEPILMLRARGGLGKSALIAEFLSRLGAFGPEAAMPVAYLDFDHSSLDVRRPLTLMREIASQLELQYPGHFASFEVDSTSEESFDRGLEIGGAQTERYLDQLAWLLEELVAREGRALVVLETFERAQSRSLDFSLKTVGMIWRLRARAKGLRILVAGRARVEGIRNEKLGDLDPEAADGLLGALGIADETLRAGLIKRIGGSPLTIKLAARLSVLEQVTARDLEDGAWDEMFHGARVEGELYQRVLEHIDNRQARRLAHPGLVLRSLNERLILEVLAPTLGVDIADLEAAKKALAGLRRVHDLVRTREDGALELRPSIRRDLLPLIARDERRKEQIRQVHQAAANWFDDEGGPGNQAEAIYHYLMLGRVAEAEKRWHHGLELYFEEDDLLELPEFSKSFLSARLNLDQIAPEDQSLGAQSEIFHFKGIEFGSDTLISTTRGDSEQQNWERRAASRVRDLVASGDLEGARSVLGEHTERLPGSSLFQLEVEVYQALNDSAAASKSIEQALEMAELRGDEEAQVDLLMHRARIHEKEGSLEMAHSDWDEAVELARTSLEKSESLTLLEAEVGRTEFLERQFSERQFSERQFSERHPRTDKEDLRQARRELDQRVEQTRTHVLISNPELAQRTAAQLSSSKGMLRVLSDVGFKDVKPDLSNLVSNLGRIPESGDALRDLGGQREAQDDTDRAAIWSNVMHRAADQDNLGPALKVVLDQLGDREGVTSAVRDIFAQTVQSSGPTAASKTDTFKTLVRLQKFLDEAFTEEKLHQVLSEQFGFEWVDALPESKTRTGYVFAAVSALRRSGFLITALQAFASSVARQQHLLRELSSISEDLGFGPIALEDPFEANLLFGRNPFLGQRDLRERCRQLASEDDGPRVLFVKGERGSGRTYVARFLEHVSRNTGGFPSFDVAYGNVETLHRLEDLVESLRRAIPEGGVEEWPVDPWKSPQRSQREVADRLFTLLVQQRRRVWIVLDGLSRSLPTFEIKFFIEALLWNILESSDYSKTPRLVLLDHPEPNRWPDLPGGVASVELSRISQEDIREFLRRIEVDELIIEEIIGFLDEHLDKDSQPLGQISHLLQKVLEDKPWT